MSTETKISTETTNKLNELFEDWDNEELDGASQREVWEEKLNEFNWENCTSIKLDQAIRDYYNYKYYQYK